MADMKTAMKAKEEGRLALNTIRMARAHIRQAEIDDGHADFNDDQVLAVLRKEVKQRKETLAEIAGSGREDLVKQTKAEIEVLEKYLPAEMSAEEVEKIVKETIDALDPGQMEHAGWFRYVKGFLIGRPLVHGQEMMGLDQYHAVLDIIAHHNVPVIMDADLGHIAPMLPLISGSYANITATGNNLVVDMKLK